MSPRPKPDQKLALYRAKRDFTKTSEPPGARRPSAAKALRFVIQKHAARRLHYDLRLELGGVMKSWAVTKGPSLDPADKRLAVEVEDHPLEYGDFEGSIPKGQYGGGTVMVWDRGYWAPEPGQDPEKALAKGELKFVLAGEKLAGGWVLVRLKPREGDKKNNWLLIKHRDEHAREGGADVLEEERSVASGRTMEEIAAGKGRRPKPFMSKATIAADAVWSSNREPEAATAEKARPERPAAPTPQPLRKAKRAAMPRFVPPQLCRLATAAPSGPGWAHEVKFDGYRLQLRVEKGQATLLTRKGLDWTDRFPALAAEARSLPDCIVDGELIAYDEKGEPSFDALQEAIAEGRTDDAAYFAFDLLFAEGYDLRPLPLSERKARLEALLADAGPIIRYTTHIEGSGRDVVAAACEMGLEGIVSKRLDAPYRSARTDAWVKIKCRRSESVVIGGWLEEDGRFKSILAGVPEKNGLRYIGKVGTGFGQRAVERLLPALRAMEADASPFVSGPAPKRGAKWAKPRLVAEVELAGWTTDGLLRQAAYKGLREDLSPSDVSREPEETAKAAATTPRPPAQKRGPLKVRGVAISSEDKVIWPATEQSPAYAKSDLAAYLDKVGDWMIEHLRGRPCSLVRAPDGIEGETFFQRHANKGSPQLFTRTKVSGEKEPYLQIDTVEALIAAAQIAAVELHPWNCEPGNPEVPGRLVFDLDPAPDVGFDRVIEAARELKDRLADLGLESFCKSTGGKGLHVVTPFAPEAKRPPAWPEAKAFAHDVCRRMAADSPDRYLVVMTKSKRTGRIFLDYLRNDRTATAVAPLSPRARAGAPVSMPLTWGQVRKGLDAQRYTITTAAGLLAKSKPWADYADAARPFRDAAERLAKQ